MKKEDSVKYLGDYISSDGSNKTNIIEREKKGIIINNQLKSLINEISLGGHYFKIGLLYRDTNIVNGLLFNSEVRYGLRQTKIDILESIDEMYMRQLFGAHSKTPIEAFYLESGKVLLRYVLKSRRLMYWWSLVRLSEDKMLSKFYYAQKNNPVKDDWINQVDKDKKELNINLNDNDIKRMSKYMFKKFLKEKIKSATLKYLNELKKKHIKVENLQSTELKCSKYLMDTRISKVDAKLLFKFRTRMYPVKANFSTKYQNNMLCDLCISAECMQQHLLQCPILKSFIPELKSTTLKYEFLFGNIEEMKQIVKILKQISEVREQLLQDIN